MRLQILHAFGGGDRVLTHDGLLARLGGMSPATLDEHLGILRATPADHLRYFTTFVAGLIENFARFVRRPNADIADARVSYRQVTLNLTREELQRLSDDIEELFRREEGHEPGGDRRPMVITRIIMPEVLPGEES